MFSLEGLLAATLFCTLTAYVVIAGSDLGTGFWYLVASGPRRRRQRHLTAVASGTVMDVHDVWLLLVAVILCAAFPIAFGTALLALSLPITLLVLIMFGRLTLLVWRTWIGGLGQSRPWMDTLLAVMGLVPPLILAGSLGLLGTDRLSALTTTEGGALRLSPFVIAVALLGVALFAMLAALSLYVQASDRQLKEDFRLRTFAAVVLVNIGAMTALALSRWDAPRVWQGLTGHTLGWMIIALEIVLVILTLFCLIRREPHGARTIGIASVVTLLSGWAYAQYPYLIMPDLTIYNAAAPAWSLRYLVVAVLLVSVLAPALYYVYRVFRGEMTLRKA